MPSLKQHLKDPAAVLEYPVDWSAWLDGDTIATATVTAEAGITVGSPSNTTTTVTAWLSGGTAGTTYRVTYRVTTAAGRTDERSITVHVTER